MSMPHIVIAEDEDDVRDFLLRATRRFAPHAEITAATNGASALEIFQQRGCDLLITDQRMPRMSGVELIREVRKTAAHLPVIMISADATARGPAIAAGATAFFYKPIAIIQIREIVEKWVAQDNQSP
jgi:CheY-like chemotaxis protein